MRLREQKVNFTLQIHEVAWSKSEFCASKKFKAILSKQLQKPKQTLSYWENSIDLTQNWRFWQLNDLFIQNIRNNPSPISAARKLAGKLNMPWVPQSWINHYMRKKSCKSMSKCNALRKKITFIFSSSCAYTSYITECFDF